MGCGKSSLPCGVLIFRLWPLKAYQGSQSFLHICHTTCFPHLEYKTIFFMFELFLQNKKAPTCRLSFKPLIHCLRRFCSDFNPPLFFFYAWRYRWLCQFSNFQGGDKGGMGSEPHLCSRECWHSAAVTLFCMQGGFRTAEKR